MMGGLLAAALRWVVLRRTLFAFSFSAPDGVTVESTPRPLVPDAPPEGGDAFLGRCPAPEEAIPLGKAARTLFEGEDAGEQLLLLPFEFSSCSSPELRQEPLFRVAFTEDEL